MDGGTPERHIRLLGYALVVAHPLNCHGSPRRVGANAVLDSHLLAAGDALLQAKNRPIFTTQDLQYNQTLACSRSLPPLGFVPLELWFFRLLDVFRLSGLHHTF